MTNSVNELSNKAPIILTWVPRVRGASLPNGKNSTLNYLEIIKNHKLKNKEERDIYLVINGPGFEQTQPLSAESRKVGYSAGSAMRS